MPEKTDLLKWLRSALFRKRHPSDKMEHGLIDEYNIVFNTIKNKKINLLEIGINKGASLKYWADYFKHPDSKIIGLDINPPDICFPKKVIIHKCDQNDSLSLEEIAKNHGPFDVVIDDGSHMYKETMNCFEVLFNHVLPGGYYVIEDWAVGYSENPAYKGMVNLITSIIETIPKRKIGASNIVLDRHKAIAFFRKDIIGWTE